MNSDFSTEAVVRISSEKAFAGQLKHFRGPNLTRGPEFADRWTSVQFYKGI